MPRIPPLEREQLTGEARSTFDRELARFGRLTNMKRTLLHSPAAYHALMQWYPLFDVIREFLGEKLAIVFAHSISSESDCPRSGPTAKPSWWQGGRPADI